MFGNSCRTSFRKRLGEQTGTEEEALFSTPERERDSVQEHIQKMTEVLEELVVVGDPVKQEDRVVKLLANLPESYGVLVKALEASVEVPKMKVVNERLLHEDRKQKGQEGEEKGYPPEGEVLPLWQARSRQVELLLPEMQTALSGTMTPTEG